MKPTLLRVYVKNPADGRTYRALLTPKQAKQLDNGRLVSCGLTVGEDGLTPAIFEKLDTIEVTAEDWDHQACKSRCVLRGDGVCQW